MDINELAKQFAQVIVPLLTAGAAAAASEMGKQSIIALWEKIKAKMNEKGQGGTIQAVIERPNDGELQIELKVLIREILKEYPDLAQEAERVINISASNGSVAAETITNSNVVVGQNAQIGDKYYFGTNTAQSELEHQNDALRQYLLQLKTECYLLPLDTLGGNAESDSKTTLETFYIQLNTDKFKEDPEQQEKTQNKELRLRDEEKKPITVKEAAVMEKRLLLTGVAGSGKSTAVKKLAGMQSSKRLGEINDLNLSADLLPVYLELRKLGIGLADVDWTLSAPEKRRALAQAVLEQIRQDARNKNAEGAIPLLEQAFHEGKLLLIFDGLDEVSVELRERVRLAVLAVIELHHIERMILTSRPVAEAQTAFLSDFTSYEIEPLNENQIEEFVGLWYAEQANIGRFASKEEAQRRANSLKAKALNDIPREMSSNPMMLTSIALIDRAGAELPKHRVQLYKSLVSLFSKKWQEVKAGTKDYPPVLRELFDDERKLRTTLEVLAYQTHLANYEADRKGEGDAAGADLSYGKAKEILEQQKYLGDSEKAEAFLKYMHERAGLFTSRCVKSDDIEWVYFGFSHRTIQEYLAGCHLIQRDDCGDKYLEKTAQGDYWSQSALLGAEEFIYNQTGALPLLRSLMKDLCLEPKHEQNARALLWSGQMAAQYGRKEIENNWHGDHAKKYFDELVNFTLQLIESAKHLTPRERAEAGNTLAKLGDPRIGVTNDFLFCEIPAGKFLMGSKEDEKDASDDEHPQFEYEIKRPYYMSRYPITNAQFELFVIEDGYKKEEYWSEAKQAGYWSADGFKGGYDNEVRNAPISYSVPFNLSNHPVVGVSWYEALAFTRWLTEQLNAGEIKAFVWSKKGKPKLLSLKDEKSEARLPTEAEWERATRGKKEDQPYPWKCDITPNHANYRDTQIGATSAVGLFSTGDNDYGLLDMSGNVWEWCATEWQENYAEYLGKENNNPEGSVSRVLRGGSYGNAGSYLRCAYRLWYYPGDWNGNIGFRVVVSSFPISLLRSGS